VQCGVRVRVQGYRFRVQGERHPTRVVLEVDAHVGVLQRTPVPVCSRTLMGWVSRLVGCVVRGEMKAEGGWKGGGSY